MRVLRVTGLCLLVFFFVLPVGWAEEEGISGWGVNDPTYGLKTRENEAGFSYTPSPADWRDINIYQLFTDRFASSGVDRLSGYKPGWKSENANFPYNRNYHHGGDWKGLKDNLDYLSGMGVNAVWISGVQQNDQGKDTRYTPYHMYHPENFFKCDPAMGTFQDLKDLIDACHARGIYVILDVVVNHMCDKNGINSGNDDDDKRYWANGHGSFGWWNSSNKHPAPFENLDYFHNNGTINNWDASPENLKGQFKGTDDLKTEDTRVQDILSKAFKNLIDATDCDGFRVDAIKHVEYNWIMQWATDMRTHAKWRGKNDFLMFGELFVYDSNALASYCKDDNWGFNSALFFPLSLTFKGVFGDGGWTGWLGQTMNEVAQYGEGANRLVAFLDNHDVNRFALQVGGGNVETAIWKMKPALSFLYLATPVPLLYYGTEHAFNQGGHYNGSSTSGDNPDDGDWQREAMFDKGFQPGPAAGNKLLATDAPLYGHVAWLNSMRDRFISLRRGGFTQRLHSGGAGQYVFTKWYGDQVAVVILNTSDNAISLSDWPNVGLGGQAFYENGDTSTTPRWSNDGAYLDTTGLSIEGKGTKIFICNPGSGGESLWASGTYSWPAQGAATSVDTIYINTEAGPAGDVDSVTVIWSSDGGTTWNETDMSVNTAWESESGAWYNAALGPFPTGGTLQYCLRVADADGNEFWDNNANQNYSLDIAVAADFALVGTVTRPTEPVAGDTVTVSTILATNNVEDVNTMTVTIGYTMDGGNTWHSESLVQDATQDDDRGVRYVFPFEGLAAGTTVKFFLSASNAVSGVVVDDNNGNNDYQIIVPQDITALRMVEGTPSGTDAFDLVQTGGALQTQSADGQNGGFGDFGSIYVNYDAYNVYIGGTGMSLPTDVNNNVVAVFISAGNNPGAENFWYCNSQPNGLDKLHNVGFARPIQLALLLGDAMGGGSYGEFRLYENEGPDTGQGYFVTPYNSDQVSAEFGSDYRVSLKQFDKYGINNRQASSWICSISLDFFGVDNIEDLGPIYISGLLLSHDQNSEDSNTYLSGKYLGLNCELPVADEPLDEYNNIGKSYVYLTGAPFSLGEIFVKGVPEEWLVEQGLSTDPASVTEAVRRAYFAGLNPDGSDELSILDQSLNSLQVHRHASATQACSYILDYANELVPVEEDVLDWNWTPTAPLSSSTGRLTLPGNLVGDMYIYRVRVQLPPE